MFQHFIAAGVITTLVGLPIANAKPDLKASGIVWGGYQVERRKGPEAGFQLRLKSKRVQKTRAVIKIEGGYFNDSLEVEDAFADHKISERIRLQFGVNKKRLGLEYEQSRTERLTPERSQLYRKLEGLGIVGRQLNLRLKTKATDTIRVDTALGTDGSRNVNFLLHASKLWADFGLGYWGLYEEHRVDKEFIPVTAHALSAYTHTGRLRLVAELIGGIDPNATQTNRLFDTGQRVWFYGPKLELAYRFRVGPDLEVQPLGQASFTVNDAKTRNYNSLQLLVGANLLFKSMNLAIAGERIDSSARERPHERGTAEHNLYVRVRHAF